MFKLNKLVFVFVSFFITAHAIAQTHSLPAGWSLVGNDTGAGVDPVAVFGNATTPTSVSPSVTTVWTWNNSLGQWNFFAPSMTPQALSTYAASKGYGVLSTIVQGEGFWVNAKNAVSVNLAAPTTAAIQANMNTNYNNEQLLIISNAIQGCFRQWGISGNAISCSVSAKQSSVQNFLSTVLANIQTVKNSTPIDKTAISTMLTSYQTQDFAWLTVNSLSPTYAMSSGELAAVTPTYNSSVNTSYSNALIQLSGM